MTLAAEADDALGMVSAAQHAAVIPREGGAPNDALKLYQLAVAKLSAVPHGYAELPADQAGLHVRSALTWALLERPEHAHRELQRAADLPLQSDPFERADTDYNRAEVQLALGRVDIAEQYATTALRTWSDSDRRESTGARITLATTHALTGEPDAPRLAAAALEAVEHLRSLRNRARIAPLEKALAAREDRAYAELAQRARALRTNTAQVRFRPGEPAG
jgi:tetratricopeptide (TPR) repeat protein